MTHKYETTLEEAELTYSVKEAAALAGLTVHTVRMWERRYNAIDPLRTDTQRRRYSRSDIERLRLLKLLTTAFHQPIRNVSKMSDHDLRQLAASKQAPKVSSGGNSDNSAALDLMIRHLEDLDLITLAEELAMARLDSGARRFTLEVVAPVMQKTGMRVFKGELTVAHEHAISSLVRGQLFECLSQAASCARSGRFRGRLVASTMEGDHHEIGILCGALLCAVAGYEVHYLGPNIPCEHLGYVCRVLHADMVMIGRVPLPPRTLVRSPGAYLSALAAGLSENARILLGGSWNPADVPPELPTKLIPNLQTLDDWLQAGWS